MAPISQLFGHTASNAAVRCLSLTFVVGNVIKPAIVGAFVILVAIGTALCAEKPPTKGS